MTHIPSSPFPSMICIAATCHLELQPNRVGYSHHSLDETWSLEGDRNTAISTCFLDWIRGCIQVSLPYATLGPKPLAPSDVDSDAWPTALAFRDQGNYHITFLKVPSEIASTSLCGIPLQFFDGHTVSNLSVELFQTKIDYRQYGVQLIVKKVRSFDHEYGSQELQLYEVGIA